MVRQVVKTLSGIAIEVDADGWFWARIANRDHKHRNMRALEKLIAAQASAVRVLSADSNQVGSHYHAELTGVNQDGEFLDRSGNAVNRYSRTYYYEDEGVEARLTEIATQHQALTQAWRDTVNELRRFGADAFASAPTPATREEMHSADE